MRTSGNIHEFSLSRFGVPCRPTLIMSVLRFICASRNYIIDLFDCILSALAMHSLAAASRPRLSETVPKWFMFENSYYAFAGRIRRFGNLYIYI